MTMADYSKLSEGEKIIANELFQVRNKLELEIQELRAEVTAFKVAVTEATAFDRSFDEVMGRPVNSDLKISIDAPENSGC